MRGLAGNELPAALLPQLQCCELRVPRGFDESCVLCKTVWVRLLSRQQLRHKRRLTEQLTATTSKGKEARGRRRRAVAVAVASEVEGTESGEEEQQQVDSHAGSESEVEGFSWGEWRSGSYTLDRRVEGGEVLIGKVWLQNKRHFLFVDVRNRDHGPYYPEDFGQGLPLEHYRALLSEEREQGGAEQEVHERGDQGMSQRERFEQLLREAPTRYPQGFYASTLLHLRIPPPHILQATAAAAAHVARKPQHHHHTQQQQQQQQRQGQPRPRSKRSNGGEEGGEQRVNTVVYLRRHSASQDDPSLH